MTQMYHASKGTLRTLCSRGPDEIVNTSEELQPLALLHPVKRSLHDDTVVCLTSDRRPPHRRLYVMYEHVAVRAQLVGSI